MLKLFWPVVMLIGLAGCQAGGFKKAEPPPDRPLKCYVGVNMKATVEEVAAEYFKRTGIRIETEVNNPRPLIGKIELSDSADLFVCHDPFLPVLIAHGVQVKQAWTAASLVPTIAVQKGNPQNIRDITDLARPGLKIGVTDMNSMSGNIVAVMTRRAGIESQFRSNVIKEYPAGRELAADLMSGKLDAGVVWNVVITTFNDKLDGVNISAQWRPVRGVDALEKHPELGDLELDYVRVTVAVLATSKYPRAATEFAELLSGPVGQAAFRKRGFAKPDLSRPALLHGLDGKK